MSSQPEKREEEGVSMVVEAYLCEMLSGQSPPDLRESILARLVSGEDSPSEWDQARTLAQRDLAMGIGRTSLARVAAMVHEVAVIQGDQHVPPSISVFAGHRHIRNADGPSRDVARSPASQLRRWAWTALAVTAASVLVAAWPWISPGPEADPGTSLAGRSLPPESSRPAVDSEAGILSDPNSPPWQPLSPANPGISSAPDARSIADTIHRSAVPAAMGSAEIVDVIDAQFAQMWKRCSVQPLPEVESTEWAQRATQLLVGREPTATELERAGRFKATSDRLEWLEELTQTRAFADQWSQRLSNSWLRNSNLDGRESAREAFRNWLRDEIAEGSTIVQLQKDMLVAQGTDVPNRSDHQPAAHWLVSQGAGSERIVAQIGHQWLDRDLGCLQCHDSDSSNADLRRETFWGVATLLDGIQFTRDRDESGPITLVKHQKAKERFFERRDGSLATAKPTFPDGEFPARANPETKPTDDRLLEEFVGWLETSPWRTSAEVSQIWTNVFGQRLLPSYGLSSEDGLDERGDLQHFLANQLAAHRGDFRKLLSWIVASRPLRVGHSQRTTNQYLLASAREIQRWQQTDRLFAGFPIHSMRQDEGSSARLQQVARWLRAQQVDSKEQVLAQPGMALNANSRPPRSVKNGLDETQLQSRLQMVIHSQRLPQPLAQQVQSWIGAKLTWEQLVQHASWLSTGSAPSEAFRKTSAEILNESKGDQSLAISRILLAELGYF